MKRGALGNDVFSLLVQSGRPMHISAIAKHLPYSYKQVTDSCARMARDGVISKVKRGVYIYRTDPAVAQEQVEAELLDGPEPEPEDWQPALTEVTSDLRDDMREAVSAELDVDQIIDLLFPPKVTPKQGVALARWREDTIALVLECRG
jgi:hypothetical protein